MHLARLRQPINVNVNFDRYGYETSHLIGELFYRICVKFWVYDCADYHTIGKVRKEC